MASSSHTCSGTWADLPQAASNSRQPSAVAQAGETFATELLTTSKRTEPNSENIAKLAANRPRSPTLLVTKAFLAARAAELRSCQKPISR